jgi:HAE1 family hydrophobic/amphiphilic exporter-1
VVSTSAAQAQAMKGGLGAAWIGKPRRVLLTLLGLCALLTPLALSVPLGYLPRPVRKSILVTVERRGAFEEEVERALIEPLEEAVARIPGLQEMFCLAERERARINLTFLPDSNLDRAYLEVREAVQAAYLTLPEDVQRPVILKSDLSGRPVFIAAFPPGAEAEELERRFEAVEGAGEVEIGGGGRPELLVSYDAQKLAAAGLSFEQIVQALRRSNVAGGFGASSWVPWFLDARFRRPEQLGSLFLGAGLRLGELASVSLQSGEPRSIAQVNGRQRLVLYVQPAGDANLLSLCRRLRRVAGGVGGAEVLYDYGRLIQDALEEVLLAVAGGALLVVILTLLFMRRLAAALLVSAEIPFAILFALAALRLGGHELDVLSLSGIAVGVGLVIDGGIVLADELLRGGGGALEAVRRTRAPLLFSAATTLAVFVPLAFAPRELTDQFGGLAVAVAASLTASCLYTLLFLPAFLGGLCPRRGGAAPAPSARASAPEALELEGPSRAVFDWLRRRRWVALAAGVILLGTAVLLALGLRPRPLSLGREPLRFTVEYASGRTMASVYASASPLESQLSAQEGVERVVSRYEPERATFDVTLRRGADREGLLRGLRRWEGRLPEAFLHFPQAEGEEDSFTVVLTGTESQTLRGLAGELAGELRRLPGAAGIVYHFKEALPARMVVVDPVQAARLGVSPRDVQARMFWALSAPVADKWRGGAEEMDIRLTAAPISGPAPGEERKTLAGLLQLPITGAGGAVRPLRELVRVSERAQGGRLYRLNRRHCVSFSVLTAARRKPQLIRAAQALLARAPLPPGYRTEAAQEEQRQGRLSLAAAEGLALAVLLIFYVLMFQFERLSVALVVMLQIPFSFLFPLLLLRAAALPLGPPAVVGLILTAGIAVNNAILVFGEPGTRGLAAAGLCAALGRKLRPLLLASLTTVAGILPLLLSGGAGQGVLAPLSLTVAAGIAGSVLVLFASLAVVAQGPSRPESRSRSRPSASSLRLCR